MMDEPIKNIKLTFNCPVDWNRMDALADGKYCNHCHKKVYDLTNSKQEELLKLLAENSNNICGKFRQEQMSPKHTILRAWKKWVSAAVVLIGMQIFNIKSFAQTAPLRITKQKTQTKEPLAYVGGIGTASTLPEFPGGSEAFTFFLAKNIHYTKNMKNGRVIISFTVSVNGSLKDFKIEKSLGPLNDHAAINALKLSPRWKPGNLNGKNVAVKYFLPVNFQK